MGRLICDGEQFTFDDRLLAHLQIVVSTKLRRGESFFLGWNLKTAAGSGRRAVWIDRGVPIQFVYHGARMPAINRQWVEDLAHAANSTGGLVLTDEPVEEVPEGRRPHTSEF